MRVLVTGGAGFLGSHLVDRLLAEGHTVDAVDDLSGGSLGNLADARVSGGRLSFHRLDVRGPDLAALLGRRQPELVYHLARFGAAGDGAAAAGATLSAAMGLLEAARACGAGKVVVALPAAELYAEASSRQLPVRESHPLEPRTPAGVAARAVLDALRLWRERYDLEHTALALGAVYGPRQVTGPVAAVAAAVARGEAFEVAGDGRRTDDYVYVDDAVDALARAAGRGGGLLLNVGTGVETSVVGLVGLVAAAARAEAHPQPAPSAPAVRRRFALDPQRAALHLGWEPWTPLVEGTAATVGWWRSRPG